MNRILFVCTGNTCRSCMAEAIAKRMIENDERFIGIEVFSAGIAAVPGDRASYEAAAVMREYGIDLSSHCSRQISEEEIDKADLVLTMTISQKNMLKGMSPVSIEKLFTLKEYVNPGGRDFNIQDPFGQSTDVYRGCAAELRVLIEKMLEKMIK